MSTETLIERVHRGDVDVAAFDLLDAGQDSSELPRAILVACEAVAATANETRAEVLTDLERAGVSVDSMPPRDRQQRHTLTLDVADAAAARRAERVLAEAGFEPWARWSGGACRSFERHAGHRTVVRSGDATSVVRLRWERDAPPRSRVRRVFRPTEADWAMVDLPTRLWWAYPLVRVLRLVAERMGLRRRRHPSLGPFLSTPVSLLDPLLDLVEASGGDTVVDLGCGDGRMLEAAAKRGCTAVGFEKEPALAERARQRIIAAGVADRVTVVTGDARGADLSAADVVFVFLPTDVVARLLPSLLSSMRSGARLVAHEQNRLPAESAPAPADSRVVVSENAVTVAHVWRP